MHRFYLPIEQCQGPLLMLTAGEAHHALHVLRVRRGEPVVVLDGVGQEYSCEVQSLERQTVGLRLLERRTVAPLAYQLTLLQAIPKGKLIESIIQKATELGAHRIVPLLSERVVSRLDAPEAKQKALKWQQVAIEALKQCGSAWLTRVEVPVSVEQFLAAKPSFELPLVGSLQPGSRHPGDFLRAFRLSQQRQPRSACIWIGPEGDFSPAEYKAIEEAGALPITLGRLVLRTETAAIYCLSVLNYELQSALA